MTMREVSETGSVKRRAIYLVTKELLSKGCRIFDSYSILISAHLREWVGWTHNPVVRLLGFGRVGRKQRKYDRGGSRHSFENSR
jgi:hypothetical protein